MAGSDAKWEGTADGGDTYQWATYFTGADELEGEPKPCPLTISNLDSRSTVAGKLKNSFNAANSGTGFSARLVGTNKNGVEFLGGTVESMTIQAPDGDPITVGTPPNSTPVAGMTVQEVVSMD